jgi:hypothetical protein
VSVIHKLITSICYKEEMPDQWKESIIVPIQKMGDKTDCNNYCGISLLSISYEILSNILLSRLSPHKTNKLRGLQSASEIYRLSDRHLSAKCSANFCG